jgi:hypothetical protein
MYTLTLHPLPSREREINMRVLTRHKFCNVGESPFCIQSFLTMSLSTYFWIFPVEVFGSSVKTTVFGHLK